LSEPITFERDGVVYCLRFVPLAYQEYVTHVTARSVLYTISYPATSAELAAAGYMRVPSVEELAKILFLYTTPGLERPMDGHEWYWDNEAPDGVKEMYREDARAVLRALGVETDGTRD